MNTLKYISSKLLVITPLLCASMCALAQSDLRTDLLQCAANNDVLQRLACYDALADTQQSNSLNTSEPTPTVVQAAPPPRPIVIEPTPMPKPAPTPVESFGRDDARISTNEDGAEALSDTVASVKRVEPTKLQITLASGQVWRQSVGKRFVVREGDRIEISQSGWGSDYRLFVVGKKGFIQVARMQ